MQPRPFLVLGWFDGQAIQAPSRWMVGRREPRFISVPEQDEAIFNPGGGMGQIDRTRGDEDRQCRSSGVPGDEKLGAVLGDDDSNRVEWSRSCGEAP
jgi:hypothetical protein